MSSERWPTIESLFQAALAVPADERAALLEAGTSDEDLRREVEALLAAHDRAEGFIESPAFRSPGPEPADADAEALVARDRIGPYRPLRVLGAGGMGVVLAAEQASPHRMVALKVVRRSPGLTPRHATHLRREIETLARLDHPGIARIYDAGTTEDGLPYFAMELVEGAQLDAYVAERAPSRTERIALFILIAEAVSAAHRRGVIHRDLKPSNIMVTASDGGPPGVKILDFGLARVTDAETGPDGAGRSETDAGRLVGSLPYMSPEQTRGGPAALDTRSDVYALGLLLYELLTDRRPYDLASASSFEAARIICEQPPVPPSRHDRSLRGDLETIVLEALAKARERRYASAEAMVNDVRRFLAHRPIAARPPRLTYQLGRFLRRRPAVSALAAGLVLALVAGTIVTARQNRVIRRERDLALRASERAMDEVAKAREIQAFLQRMLAAVKPANAQGEEVTVRAVLDEASAWIDEELTDRPDVEAALRFTIGSTYRELARYDEAEAHLRRSLALRRAIHPGPHPELVESLIELGLLHRQRSRPAEAAALYYEALELARRAPDLPADQVLDLLNNLGMLEMSRGNLDEAERLLTEALAAREAEYGPDHIEVALGLNSLGLVYNARHDYVTSQPLFARSLAILRAQLPEEHPWLGSAIYNYAALLQRLGDLDGAEAQYRAVLALDEKVFGPDHPNVATTLNAIASTVERAGRGEEAEALYREGLRIRRAAYGEEHRAVAESLSNLGLLLHRRGWYAVAVEHFEGAVAIHAVLYEGPHPSRAITRTNYGTTLRVMGRADEAETVLRGAVADVEALHDEDHPNRLRAEAALAMTLVDLGALDEAEPRVRSVAARTRDRFGPDDERTATSEADLATVWRLQGRSDEAEETLQAVLAVRSANGDDTLVVNTIHRLALVAFDAGDLETAEIRVRDALRRGETTLAADHPDRERSLVLLARVLLARGDTDAALAVMDEALAVDARRRGQVVAHATTETPAAEPLPPTRAAVDELIARLDEGGDVASARRMRGARAAWDAVR